MYVAGEGRRYRPDVNVTLAARSVGERGSIVHRGSYFEHIGIVEGVPDTSRGRRSYST